VSENNQYFETKRYNFEPNQSYFRFFLTFTNECEWGFFLSRNEGQQVLLLTALGDKTTKDHKKSLTIDS
jgi:hypothetical protein